MANLKHLLLAGLLAVSTPTMAADTAAFDAFGGKAGIDRVAGDLVARMVADARIGAFFKESNPERLQKMLAEQFCAQLSGPCTYSGQTMQQSHARFEIRREHFNRLVELLQEAMIKNDVPFWAQNKLLAKLAPMARDVMHNADRTGLPVAPIAPATKPE